MGWSLRTTLIPAFLYSSNTSALLLLPCWFQSSAKNKKKNVRICCFTRNSSLKKKKKITVVALQCCVNVCYTAKWISYTYSQIPSFSGFPSPFGRHRALSLFPVLYSRFSSIINFIHSINNAYMSAPISQFIPALPSPLGVHTLFSTSVSLFLLCK